MMIVVFVSLDVISFSVTSISYRGEPSSIYSVHEVEYWQQVNEIQKPAVSATYEEFDVQKLSILLPELQQGLPAGAVAHFLRSSQEQLLLWEATSRFLASISQKQPLLLVLDDLHSADDSSLELLSYLIRYLNTQSNQHVLLVGTCRETELAQAHRLRSFISSMQREQAITTLIPTCVHWYKSHMGSLASYLIGELFLRAQVGIRIQPLTQAQIGTLVAPLPDPIVQHIQTQAAGNPFFAEELARTRFLHYRPRVLSREGRKLQDQKRFFCQKRLQRRSTVVRVILVVHANACWERLPCLVVHLNFPCYVIPTCALRNNSPMRYDARLPMWDLYQ